MLEFVLDSLIKIDFHIHSNFSDGMFSPEILADELAIAGVKYAALTDHDNIDGLQRFENAASARGIRCINGVEMSASMDGCIYHLLAYGFDRTHKLLHQELVRTYKHLHPGISAWLDKMKLLWHHFVGRQLPEASCLISVNEALSLVNDAGGHAFLAHPLTLYKSNEQFEEILTELKQYGLDGIEAYYKPYSQEQSQFLLEYAEQKGLKVCSGSDFHGTIRPRLMDPGVEVSRNHLRQFFQVLGLSDLTGLTNRNERNII
jgi:predicted metal-dependent phosphoesterase TrpH